MMCMAFCSPRATLFMLQAIKTGREGKKFTGGHGACHFKLTYYKQRSKRKVDDDDGPVDNGGMSASFMTYVYPAVTFSVP